MTNSKGYIDDTNIGVPQGIQMLRDILKKCKESAVNLKDEDSDLARRLLNKFEKSARSFEILKKNKKITQTQFELIWEEL